MFIMTFLTILGVTEILCSSFKLVLDRKTGKEILSHQDKSSKKSFQQIIFALSDAENTSRSLNRGGIADLPLLRTLLQICHESQVSGK